jgi:hypothetical protein
LNGELHRLRNSIAQSNRAYHDRDQDDNEDGGKDGGEDGGKDGGKDGGEDGGKDRGKDDGPAPMGPAREASLRLGLAPPGQGKGSLYQGRSPECWLRVMNSPGKMLRDRRPEAEIISTAKFCDRLGSNSLRSRSSLTPCFEPFILNALLPERLSSLCALPRAFAVI